MYNIRFIKNDTRDYVELQISSDAQQDSESNV